MKILSVLKDYVLNAFRMSGRSSKKDYWIPVLMVVLVSVLLAFVPFDSHIILKIWLALNVIPLVGVSFRRYNDSDSSPLVFVLLALVGFGFLYAGFVLSLLSYNFDSRAYAVWSVVLLVLFVVTVLVDVVMKLRPSKQVVLVNND